MDTKDNMLSICDSLYVLGQQKIAEDIRMIAEKGRPSLEDLFVIVFKGTVLS